MEKGAQRMKRVTVRGIRNCPLCGAKAVVNKNASKDFQVACSKCGCRTGWYTKPEARATWYNQMIQLWENDGRLTLDATKKG